MTPASEELKPVEATKEYEAPRILWEEEFVALAQTSPIVTPNCPLGSSPDCTP